MPIERRSWLPAAIVCAAVLVAYSNSFTGGFVLDSQSRILQDPRVTAVTAQNIGLIFSKDYWYPASGGGLYRPLTTLSYLFNYAVLGGGRNPISYHAINFLLHALNILLVYQFVLLLSGDLLAATAAAIWALHPVATESVTNIVGRADLLSAAAILGALLCHVRARPWPLALCTAAGIFSKESAVVIPALMLVYDVAFPKDWKSRLPNYAAAIAPLLAFWLIRARVFSHLPAVEFTFVANPIAGADFLSGRLTAIKVIGKCLGLLIWPARLSTDYSYNQIPLVASWLDPAFLAALLACIAIALGAILCLRRRPAIFFFAAFLFVTLLPTSNLILPIGAIMAERFLYLPALAFAFCLAAAISALVPSPRLAAAALSIIAVALAARTWARNLDWASDEVMFRHAVADAPASFKTHWSFAWLLYQKDPTANLDAAIREIDQSIAILDPLADNRNAAPAYSLAGELYRLKGDLAPADKLTWYRASLDALLHGERIDRARAARIPNTGWPPLYLNLGVTYLRLGEAGKAIPTLEYSRVLDPRPPDLYLTLASALRATRGNRHAIVVLLEGLALNPRHPQILADLSAAAPDCRIAPADDLLRVDHDCPALHPDICAAWQELADAARAGHDEEAARRIQADAAGRYGCVP